MRESRTLGSVGAKAEWLSYPTNAEEVDQLLQTLDPAVVGAEDPGTRSPGTGSSFPWANGRDCPLGPRSFQPPGCQFLADGAVLSRT